MQHKRFSMPLLPSPLVRWRAQVAGLEVQHAGQLEGSRIPGHAQGAPLVASELVKNQRVPAPKRRQNKINQNVCLKKEK